MIPDKIFPRTGVPYFLIFLLFNLFIDQCFSSGVFEIRLNSFENYKGVDKTGTCCTNSPDQNDNKGDSLIGGSKCGGGQCNTYFTVCLRHYQANIKSTGNSHSMLTDAGGELMNDKASQDDFGSVKSKSPGSCTFGSFMTPILGGNSFHGHDHIYALPFSFSWPGTFSLIIEAWHNNSLQNNINHLNSNEQERLLIKLATQKSVSADSRWTSDAYLSTHSKLKYSYRVVCDRHYFGKNCANLCRPRDDKFGHYLCGRNGQKICKQGWNGPYCTQAVCARGCHSEHGYCENPGECRCRLGYKGKYCEDCIRYPGCSHGTCHQPWQCNCQSGWGGLFCNQDLNYCINHKPCKNGGQCTNSGQGSFTCICPEGFTGINCEIDISKCDSNLCLNDASCKLSGEKFNYSCQCLPGYVGKRCHTNTFTCSDNPCQNQGQCSDLTDGGYKCTCSTNFTGLQCQTKQTKCQINTCKNDGRCIITEITLHSQTTTTQQHSQKCLCQKGFTGLDCSEKEVIWLINQQSKSLPISSPNSKNLLSSPDSSKLFQSHCDINPCLNGATCYERKGGASPSSSFVCRCVPGFTGSLCQIDIPDCRARPCSNGGTCTDLINDYSCNCPPGFEGKDCSVTVLIEENEALAVRQDLEADKMLNGDLDKFDQTATMTNKEEFIKKEEKEESPINSALLGQPPAVSATKETGNMPSFLSKTEMIMIACLSISFVTVTLAIIGILVVYKKKLLNDTNQTSDGVDPQNNNFYGSYVKNKNSGNKNHQVSAGLARNTLQIPPTIDESECGEELYHREDYYKPLNKGCSEYSKALNNNNDNRDVQIDKLGKFDETDGSYEATYDSYRYDKNNVGHDSLNSSTNSEIIFQQKLRENILDDGYYSKSSTFKQNTPQTYSALHSGVNKNMLNAAKNNKMSNNNIDYEAIYNEPQKRINTMPKTHLDHNNQRPQSNSHLTESLINREEINNLVISNKLNLDNTNSKSSPTTTSSPQYIASSNDNSPPCIINLPGYYAYCTEPEHEFQTHDRINALKEQQNQFSSNKCEVNGIENYASIV
ncbi:unnamed protein product [Gordionus sp. m RMFG-2023]